MTSRQITRSSILFLASLASDLPKGRAKRVVCKLANRISRFQLERTGEVLCCGEWIKPTPAVQS